MVQLSFNKNSDEHGKRVLSYRSSLSRNNIQIRSVILKQPNCQRLWWEFQPKNREKFLEQTLFRAPTSTGFSLSHSLSRSVVLFSTTLSSVTIFIWRLATCVWMDASLRLMISLNAPHSPSTLSLYSQVVGNWNRWRSRILWPSLYVSTYSDNTTHETRRTPSNNASDNTQLQ